MERIPETIHQTPKAISCHPGKPGQCLRPLRFQRRVEQSEDKQAKEILVDVYDLLGFKKSAYDLLCQIGDRSDKKILKRLGTLKDYRRNGEITTPSPSQKRRRKKGKRKSGGPSWACPLSNIILTLWIPGPLRNPRRGVVCDCCGKTTHIFYTAPFFSVENIAYLCPACIARWRGRPEISWQFSGQLLFGRWRRQSRETG